MKIKIIWILLVILIGFTSPLMAHEGAPHATKLKVDTEEVQATALPNTMCPVTTDEPVEPDIFEEYKGQKIYFCCKKCRKTFIENPEKYLQNLPQFAALASVDIVDEDAIDPLVDGHDDTDNEHDHIDHDRNEEETNRLIGFVGKFHPIVVHFPIALIVIAALAELLFMGTKKELFFHTARFCVMIGGASAFVAVMLGFAAGSTASYPDNYVSVLETHKLLGITTGVFSIVAAFLSEMYHRKHNDRVQMLYRALLFASAILVGLTGHFGGTLIYGLEYLKW